MLFFLYRKYDDTIRYDLKFNVNYGRPLYTNRTYNALVAWTTHGYSIIDFADNDDREMMKRNAALLSFNDLQLDCIVTLNCWDIMYLMENKEIHREDFIGMFCLEVMDPLKS